MVFKTKITDIPSVLYFSTTNIFYNNGYRSRGAAMFREYCVPSAIHIFIPRRNISFSWRVMHPASISGLQIRATLLLLFLRNSYHKPVSHCSMISSINATCYLKASGQRKYIIMLFPIPRGDQMCIKMTSFAEPAHL